MILWDKRRATADEVARMLVQIEGELAAPQMMNPNLAEHLLTDGERRKIEEAIDKHAYRVLRFLKLDAAQRRIDARERVEIEEE